MNQNRYDEIIADRWESDRQFMIGYICREVTLMLMNDYGWDILTALDVLYNSETYSKLENPDTGMYLESPVYVYDMLSEEIKKGRLAQENEPNK